MNDLFQIASIGMADGQRRLEAISRNTANAGTMGYRRNVVAGVAFDALAGLQARAGASGARPSALEGVDTHPAAMAATGRPLDVAIDADDQFLALTDGSRTWLTRAGALHVGDDGVVTGAEGLRVVGTQGDLHVPTGDLRVTSDGHLLSKGEVVGALQLVRVEDRASLAGGAGVLLQPMQGTTPVVDAHVRGGMLEASNTDPAREMVDALAISRQFEALSRVVQGYDDALGQAIQKLGSI